LNPDEANKKDIFLKFITNIILFIQLINVIIEKTYQAKWADEFSKDELEPELTKIMN